MTGRIIDNVIYSRRKERRFERFKYLDTDYGKIRIFDSGHDKPIIINAPDAPNTIEHQLNLIKQLSTNFRVICFEYPGVGFSFPNSKFDYSFKHGSDLIFQIMKILNIQTASLLFSCSNGYYALNAAMNSNNIFKHIFISQTPSIEAIVKWTSKSIPFILRVPFLGQLSNQLLLHKLTNIWYDVALPRDSNKKSEFKNKAFTSLNQGGCFCLSSLTQGLSKDKNTKLNLDNTNISLIWGGKDFSHRNTAKESIRDHVSNCEIIEFDDCGHFPELERTERYVKLVNERLV